MFRFVNLYVGERYMSANVHGLLHLPQCVQKLGPLWYHSCFQFESANGELLGVFLAHKLWKKRYIHVIKTYFVWVNQSTIYSHYILYRLNTVCRTIIQ